MNKLSLEWIPGAFAICRLGSRDLLPELGPLEHFRQQQQTAREICRQLRLPELPDVSSIDAAGQEFFYHAFQGLRHDPHDPAHYGLLGRLYEAQTFPEHAAALYRRTIDLDPGDYQWHYQLGLLLQRESDLVGAAHQFDLASRLSPVSSASLFSSASISYRGIIGPQPLLAYADCGPRCGPGFLGEHLGNHHRIGIDSVNDAPCRVLVLDA